MKRGEVVDQTGLENVLQETKILGVDDKVKGKKWKQTFDSIRRFKEVEITKTDKDIKNKGTEVIILGSGEFGIVKGYQDIALYEHVDFGRPSSGMGIGMMPAKLTHILLNIAKGEKKHATVWDPFTGFATTNFIANACGHHTIGSDINITQAKNNFKRRQEETNKQYQADYRMTLFKHDVTQTFKKPFLRDVDCIVSEGWLGPLVSGRTHAAALQENIPKIANVYQGFLHNIFEFYKDSKNKKPTIVISVPEYQYYQGEQVQQHLEEFIGGE